MAEDQKKRKGDWLDTAGTALGAGAGFLVGGPPGAMTGAQLGGTIGGTAEKAINKELTPGGLIGDATGAVGGYGSLQQAMGNKQAMDLLRQLTGAGFPMGFAAGGMVPGFPGTAPVLDPENARLLEMLSGVQHDPYAGMTAEQAVGPAPEEPDYAQAKHPGWEAAAQVLGEVLGKLPAPRQTASSNKTIGAYMPALGAGLSGVAKVAQERRDGVNKPLREEYLNKRKAYDEGLNDVRVAMLKRKMGLDGGDGVMDPGALQIAGAPPEVRTKAQYDAWVAKLNRQRADLNTLFDNASKLPDVGQFVTIRDAYKRIRSAAAGGSGVSDMALIFAVMKMLDPTSVVREGEYATAAKAGLSVPESIWRAYNRALTGAILSPDQRKNFLQLGMKEYENKRGSYRTAIQTVRKQAKFYGLEPSLVLPDYEVPKDWDPGQVSQAAPEPDVPVDDSGVPVPDIFKPAQKPGVNP